MGLFPGSGRPNGGNLNVAGASRANGVRLPDFIAVQLPAWSTAPELSRRRRTAVLTVCCSALFMVGIDNTSVNVALPSISRQLHASVAGQQRQRTVRRRWNWPRGSGPTSS
jgi:hypothetical protein